MAFRSGNPALTKDTFNRFSGSESVLPGETMTIQGSVNKTAVLLILLIASASYTWHLLAENPGLMMILMIVGLIAGLIFALITIFVKKIAAYTSPFYALAEGLFLGGISVIFEQQFPGIVIQAVALTFGTLLALLAAYKSGVIKATENFKLGVVAATGAIFLVYVVTFILGLFGIGVPYIHGNGIVGIIFSLVVVVIAALNLVLDFDFIEHGEEAGAPKYMEWYAAFGLMVTLVWLYIEILHLLAKLQSRR